MSSRVAKLNHVGNVIAARVILIIKSFLAYV